MSIAARDFSAQVRRSLTRKGVNIIGVQALPDMSSPMPYANATRGYLVDDNGCGRVLTYAQVEAAAR